MRIEIKLDDNALGAIVMICLAVMIVSILCGMVIVTM
jgi:hypothetical protein